MKEDDYVILELFPFYTSCLVYLELFYCVFWFYFGCLPRVVFMFDFTRPYYFVLLARMCDVVSFVLPTLEPVAAQNLFCGKGAELILNMPCTNV